MLVGMGRGASNAARLSELAAEAHRIAERPEGRVIETSPEVRRFLIAGSSVDQRLALNKAENAERYRRLADPLLGTEDDVLCAIRDFRELAAGLDDLDLALLERGFEGSIGEHNLHRYGRLAEIFDEAKAEARARAAD
jgi:hypothetical protein